MRSGVKRYNHLKHNSLTSAYVMGHRKCLARSEKHGPRPHIYHRYNPGGPSIYGYEAWFQSRELVDEGI